MKASLKLGSRTVGEDFAPLVIAEIGINHEGSLDVAKEMVLAAHRTGAEVIKHQTHVVDDEMSGAAKKVIPGNTDVSIYEVMRRCALDEQQETALKEFVESLGMIFLSTPFSRAAAERLERMGVSAYKIGSGECNNYPLIDLIASFGKPMIVSTGMNDIDSVRKTVEIIRARGVAYSLLHCTNLYPTPARLVRLGGMQALQAAFPDAVIGLSDHTVNNNACLAAAALGASVLERHFTDSKNRPGPDIVCSMDPAEMKCLIEGSREIFQMRGGEKGPAAEEKVTMDFAFATVVTTRSIEAGERFSAANIWVKRPGTGELSAEEYSKVIGKKATHPIGADQHLTWADVNTDA